MSFGNCSIKKLFKFQDNAVHFISFITVHGRPEVLCKNGIVKNFAGKHLCQGLFFNKVAGLRPAILLKQRLWHQCFPVNVTKFLRMPFFTEHLWWLLLKAADNHKIITQTHALASKNVCKNLTQKKKHFICSSSILFHTFLQLFYPTIRKFDVCLIKIFSK